MKYKKKDLQNKLIDAHTHAGISLNGFFDDKYPYCYNAIDIANSLHSLGFDFACVFSFPSYICGEQLDIEDDKRQYLRSCFENVPYQSATQKLLKEIERFKLDNLLPFAMFSINYAVDEQLQFLNSILHLIYGLKYYPDADTQTIDKLNSKGKPFLDYLIKNNMPLVVHVSENACLYNQGYSSVEDAIELAQANPHLRINVAHIGHFSRQSLEKAQRLKLKNLFFDVSPLLHLCHIRTINHGEVLNLDYHNPQKVLQELYRMFPQNLIWGSDMPFNFTCNLNNAKHNFCYADFSVEKSVNVLQSLDLSIIEKICTENVISLLFGEE